MRKRAAKKESREALLPRDCNDSEEDLLEVMRAERIQVESVINDLMKEAGKGLFQSQVELKQAPWKVMWLKQDLMIERQEKIIDLLNSINKNLENLLE